MIFGRDRRKFERAFSCWEITRIRLHTPFAYLLSGGLSMRTLFPEEWFDTVKRIERLLSPVMETFAMFATIVVRLRDE